MDHCHTLSSRGDSYGVLELCLKDILALIKPSENDHLKRLQTINEITILARSVDSLKDAVIRPFGSFISNLYTKWGDLDTSVELSHSLPSPTGRKRKQNALRDMMQVLRKNGVAWKFTFIPNARVPLIKFESNRHNVSCDVSIDNHMGWMKSRILLWISEIDERFRDLVLLTKEWAKAHNINDPTSGTLNSYSLCLLVIFHFQTCAPAILPPLKDIYGGNFVGITGSWSSIERQVEDACTGNIARFKCFRQRNPSTLSQLLISFFGKFSKIGDLSSEYAICPYTGQLERMTSNPRWMEKSHDLIIEDPFERPDNAARAVRSRELSIISEAFMTTSLKLPSYSLPSDTNSLFDILLRPNISSQLKVGTSQNHYAKHGSCEKPQIAFSNSARIADKQIQSKRADKQNMSSNSTDSVNPLIPFSGLRVDKQSQSSSSPITSRIKPQIAFSDSSRAADRQIRSKRVDKQSLSSNSTDSVNLQIPFSGLRVDKQTQSSSSIASRKKPQIAFSDSARIQSKRVDKQRLSSNSTDPVNPQISFSVQSSSSPIASHEEPEIAFSDSARRADRVDKQSLSSNSTNSVNPQFLDKQSQSSSSPIASRKKPQNAFSGPARRVAANTTRSANSTVASSEIPQIGFYGSAKRVDKQRQPSNSTIATCDSPTSALSGSSWRPYNGNNNNNRQGQSPNSTLAQPRQGSIGVQARQKWVPRHLSR